MRKLQEAESIILHSDLKLGGEYRGGAGIGSKSFSPAEEPEIRVVKEGDTVTFALFADGFIYEVSTPYSNVKSVSYRTKVQPKAPGTERADE